MTKWKNGAIPSADSLHTVSKYFNVSADYFFADSNVANDDGLFWGNFCALCRSRDLTVTQALREAGIGKGVLSQWRNGSLPSAKSLQKLSSYFKVTTDYFFTDHTDSAARLALGMLRDPALADEAEHRAVRIPIYGQIAAGVPIAAITDIEDYEEISAKMASLGDYIALRIHGDSMLPRMTEGDVVIARLQDTVDSGDTALVMVGDESATCKRVKLTDEGLMLISTNPAYEPMFFTKRQVAELPVRVFGKVVELRAKY